jgi:hypothetical protein
VSEPGDEQQGDWPCSRLLAMDRRFVERVERAFRDRRREPSTSRNQWCERVAAALEVGCMLFLNDLALVRLMIAATHAVHVSTAFELSDSREGHARAASIWYPADQSPPPLPLLHAPTSPPSSRPQARPPPRARIARLLPRRLHRSDPSPPAFLMSQPYRELIAMELHRVVLTKSNLAALPQAERSLLILLGHSSNEINVLTKLILMVRKNEPPSEIAEKVEAGQACVLLRVFVGQLHEAWELFRKRVQANRSLYDKYVPLLDASGAAALQNLKGHFGRASPLTQIRNNVAFHYTDDHNLAEKSFQSVSATERLEFYLTTQVGNSFYHASELIVMGTALRITMPGTSNDDAAAFAKLCNIVINVSRDITELFGQLMGVIMEKCLPDLETQIETHPTGPKISTLSLPYFIDFDAVTPKPVS